MQEEEIKMRLRQAMAMKQTSVRQIVGADQVLSNKVSRQLNNSSLTVEVLMMLADAMPDISLEWLLKGVGNMYRTSGENGSNQCTLSGQPAQVSGVTSVTISGNNSGNVVNNSGVMGTEELTDADFEPVDSIPVVPQAIVRVPNVDVKQYVIDNSEILDYKKVVKGNVYADMCARVKDLAMYPEFQVGDELYLLEINKQSSLANGAVYVIDTYSQGMLIRMLYDEGDHYTARARESARYTDFKIPKSDIIRMYTITQLRRVSY